MLDLFSVPVKEVEDCIISSVVVPPSLTRCVLA